ncbi:MAG: DUF1428 domain-containing protein [Methanobacteriota archaeon]
MTYVDGFVIPIRKKNVPAYRRMAKAGARVWKRHGALQYVEAIGDDLLAKMGGLKPQFPKMTKLRRDETVVFSWILYRSKAHRDRVNAKVMKDPTILKMMDEAPPFEFKRMAYAGFRVIVER